MEIILCYDIFINLLKYLNVKDLCNLYSTSRHIKNILCNYILDYNLIEKSNYLIHYPSSSPSNPISKDDHGNFNVHPSMVNSHALILYSIKKNIKWIIEIIIKWKHIDHILYFPVAFIFGSNFYIQSLYYKYKSIIIDNINSYAIIEDPGRFRHNKIRCRFIDNFNRFSGYKCLGIIKCDRSFVKLLISNGYKPCHAQLYNTIKYNRPDLFKLIANFMILNNSVPEFIDYKVIGHIFKAKAWHFLDLIILHYWDYVSKYTDYRLKLAYSKRKWWDWHYYFEFEKYLVVGYPEKYERRYVCYHHLIKKSQRIKDIPSVDGYSNYKSIKKSKRKYKSLS